MKKILLTSAALLCLLSGCISVGSGTQYLSGTVIGVKAGTPDGINLVIGYQRFEAVSCETEANVSIGIEGKVTATGINGKQHAKFGETANGK